MSDLTKKDVSLGLEKIKTGSDAVYPRKELRARDEWSNFIQKYVSEFCGNVEKAASLMMAFQKGVKYVSEESGKPKICIAKNEGAAEGISFGNVSSDFVFVNQEQLEGYASFDLDSPCDVVDRQGKLLYSAMANQIFELAGVQEADHSVFGLPDQVFHPSQVSIAIYNAQDHEYHGLTKQLEYAELNNFPDEITDYLKKSIEDARKIRESR